MNFNKVESMFTVLFMLLTISLKVKGVFTTYCKRESFCRISTLQKRKNRHDSDAVLKSLMWFLCYLAVSLRYLVIFATVVRPTEATEGQ